MSLQLETKVNKIKVLGYVVYTYFDLGNNNTLKVTTSRMNMCNGDNRYNTVVVGLTGVDKGNGFIEKTFLGGRDYYKDVVKDHQIKRATETNVLDAHNEIINSFDHIYEEAFNHYNSK